MTRAAFPRLARLSAVVLALALAACGTTTPTSRNAPLDAPPTQAAQAVQVMRAAPYAVQAVSISVPASLRVSEANVYYPIADIVWRGEPRANRHQQVKAIFETAAAQAASTLTRGRPVTIDIAVTRFHALTEKTRYTFGGTHSLKFMLQVRDAASGAVIDGPRLVVADIKASGGQVAIEEDLQGRTQKVVILEQLTKAIRRELARPAVPPSAVAPVAQQALLPVTVPAIADPALR